MRRFKVRKHKKHIHKRTLIGSYFLLSNSALIGLIPAFLMAVAMMLILSFRYHVINPNSMNPIADTFTNEITTLKDTVAHAIPTITIPAIKIPTIHINLPHFQILPITLPHIQIPALQIPTTQIKPPALPKLRMSLSRFTFNPLLDAWNAILNFFIQFLSFINPISYIGKLGIFIVSMFNFVLQFFAKAGNFFINSVFFLGKSFISLIGFIVSGILFFLEYLLNVLFFLSTTIAHTFGALIRLISVPFILLNTYYLQLKPFIDYVAASFGASTQELLSNLGAILTLRPL